MKVTHFLKVVGYSRERTRVRGQGFAFLLPTACGMSIHLLATQVTGLKPTLLTSPGLKRNRRDSYSKSNYLNLYPSFPPPKSIPTPLLPKSSPVYSGVQVRNQNTILVSSLSLPPSQSTTKT